MHYKERNSSVKPIGTIMKGSIVPCIWALFAAASATGIGEGQRCLPVEAIRGESLELSCWGVIGCHSNPPTWMNMTGDRHDEIHSGINRQTGVLTVSELVTSEIGGQRYQCSCGTESRCYDIHVPPLVTIALSSKDVPVGGEVEVTCRAVEGYPTPPPTELSLVHPRLSMTVKNGETYNFKNLGLNDTGELECILPDVRGQPHGIQRLNVFSKPQVVNVENATVATDQQMKGTATLSCTVLKNQCRTVVMFFRNGSPVKIDNEKFSRSDWVSLDGLELNSRLTISGVDPEDIGGYECRVYANYTTLLPVATQELYVSTPTTSPPPHPPPVDGSSPCSSSEANKAVVVVLAVVLAIALVGLLVLSLILLLTCYFRRRRPNKSNNPN